MLKGDAGPSLLRHWIDRAAAEHPDKPYIVGADDGRTIIYAQLQRLTRQIGAFLAAGGIGANDRVALLANNSIEHLACYLAVMAHGATICTVHVEMNQHHLAQILPALQPRLIVYEAGLGLEETLAAAPAPRFALGRWDDAAQGGFYGEVARHTPAETVLTAGPRHDACILFTSGTSARPKGVVLSFRELLSNAEPVAAGLGMTRDDRVYDFRSFNWCSAQVLSALAPLTCGASLLLGRKFSRSRFFQYVAEFGATFTAGNPTTINMLLNGDEPVVAVPTLRFVISSSAPLVHEDWRRFESRFGVPVAQSYGCSEIGWIAANPGADRRFGTVGKPLPYLQLAIVDETGRSLAADAIGHVEVGGFADNDYRYLTEDGSIHCVSRGRFRTGDIGFLDADGYLHVIGREKELIIRGGVNISPLEIDSLLMRRPDIVEAATIGVPHRTYGEDVVSYVVARPGEVVDVAELLHYCSEQLPAFKVPREIVLSERLPKTARGKLDRKALATQWLSRCSERGG